MQWLLTSHVRRYHKHYGGSGPYMAGSVKSFPVQHDEHLMTVLRYVQQIRFAPDRRVPCKNDFGRVCEEGILSIARPWMKRVSGRNS